LREAVKDGGSRGSCGFGLSNKSNAGRAGSFPSGLSIENIPKIQHIRVVQKLQFLNNNRLKTTKNADFAKKRDGGRLE
jgi:hypothetical protein